MNELVWLQDMMKPRPRGTRARYGRPAGWQRKTRTPG